MTEKSIVTSNRANFDALVNEVVTHVAESSERIYRRVYDMWADYCSNHDINPLDIIPVNVVGFLTDQKVSYETRKRYLSIMRQLAQVYAVADPIRGGQLYAALKLVRRIPKTNLSDTKRDRHALSPTQVHKVLSQWNGDTLLEKRNRALIAVLFLTALRRTEAATLRWADVNLEDGIITVVLGKGDKTREAAIAGNLAVQALQEWQDALPNREYVFPPFDVKQQVDGDKPIDGQTVYRVVKRTEKLSGVKFSPHTARRTFITEGLDQGTPLADMQAQAGHARGETTLDYARPLDAKERRKKFRHRYGD